MGNENKIFEVLFPSNKKQVPYKPEKHIKHHSVANINDISVRVLKHYLGSHRVNPADQSWRKVEDFIRGVEGLPKSLIKYDERKHAKKLLWLCWVEWACKNKKRCDPGVHHLAQELKSYLTGKTVNPTVKAAYRAVNRSHYDKYAEKSAAGGRLHGLIKFKSVARLKAVLPLLDASTRYPYTGDMNDGIIRMLPPYMDRVSGKIIHELWWSGIEFESYKQLDSKTLLVTVPIGLSLSMAAIGATSITFNALNLIERVESPERLRGDDMWNKRHTEQEKNFWCVEPLSGRPQFFVNSVYPTAWYGAKKTLDAMYDSSSDPETYLPKMMEKFYASFSKKSRHGNDINTWVDYF